MSGMTITEFLEARIAEDEEEAGQYQKYEDQIWETAGWWNPTRVLAECAAKREMLALVASSVPMQTWDGSEWVDKEDDVLRIIAAVYADHADYRKEWALDAQ